MIPFMMNQVRRILSAWEVNPYTRLQAADHRGWAYDKLSRQVGALTQYTVSSGPFCGMAYFGPPHVPTVDRHPTTKLIGSFESELHPWIESLVIRGFRTIVNIGGGEGYYAVGLAMRIPESRVVYFDTLVAARKACRGLAEQNKVRDQMQLRGFCGADSLIDIELAGSLIVCDCAGAELALLDPAVYPSMAEATLLVEIHDYFDPRITPRLRARFGKTHVIEDVTAALRNPAAYPVLSGFSESEAQLALDEERKVTRDGRGQRWALLTPAQQ